MLDTITKDALIRSGLQEASRNTSGTAVYKNAKAAYDVTYHRLLIKLTLFNEENNRDILKIESIPKKIVDSITSYSLFNEIMANIPEIKNIMSFTLVKE
ncbi:hypothetical protein Fsol_00114 [Candidatus Fokinia solitaria]|uniref:Uncharacterized protein n=1 Tax=Candidatus Fokinia solitaria TaxID=1802984 RepID=A0A2U8BRK0_9RICK|nr:hypothetical protein [Candidatus Fokinia solitaria]AWD32923.1 hypothetical protein Fsol_00114 [Candidatus Fokinia solitaria]